MAPARRSSQPGLVTGLVILATVVALDVGLGPDVVISGSYAVAAVVAGAMTSVRNTAVVAGLALAGTLVSTLWNDNFATLDWLIRILLTLGLSALAILSAGIRVRREQDLRHLTVVAETAQRARLRAMPSAIGSVGMAARYVSATREAQVGGDLYEVASSPYGVRVVVGDVRGKGLEAVQLAGTVIGAFRRAAFTQPSLADVAGEPVPPLGLGPVPSAVTSAWPQGARLLIYTDGLVETRDRRGAFFPLPEHARALSQGTLDEALEHLLQRLPDHAGARIADDLALVLVEHRADRTAEDRSWAVTPG